MFRTGSNKPIAFEAIPSAIQAFFEKNKTFGEQTDIIIGTDSQNFDETKFVSVIAVVCHGHSGIFFYEISRKRRITDVKQKLQEETNDSLVLATKLIDILTAEPGYEELFLSCPVSIHIDAGNSDRGKTKMLIPELVGWIRACGYEAKTKPDSFVASTIADRISK